MTEGPGSVLRPGHRIALGQDVYTVIRLNGTAVTVQDQHGELSGVLLGHLLTAPGFQALDAGPPRRRRRTARYRRLTMPSKNASAGLRGKSAAGVPRTCRSPGCG